MGGWGKFCAFALTCQPLRLLSRASSSPPAGAPPGLRALCEAHLRSPAARIRRVDGQVSDTNDRKNRTAREDRAREMKEVTTRRLNDRVRKGIGAGRIGDTLSSDTTALKISSRFSRATARDLGSLATASFMSRHRELGPTPASLSKALKLVLAATSNCE